MNKIKENDLKENPTYCECGHDRRHHQKGDWENDIDVGKCVDDWLNCRDGKKNRTCRCKKFKENKK